MATRYGVRGTRGLAMAFRELGRAPTAHARRNARREAAEVIAEAYKANLARNESINTGALVASIGVAEDQERRNRTLTGAREGKFKGRIPSAYSHFPEFGTAPHWQPNRFGGIMHPGARPKPALRPAYEQYVERAARAYFAVMMAEIAGAAQRIGTRNPRSRK
jgi:HK97 gp10 family phage protein